MLQLAKHPDLLSAVSALHSSVQSAETRSPSSRRTPWVPIRNYLNCGHLNLKSGVAIEQARTEVAALSKRLAAMYLPTNRGIDLTVSYVPVLRAKRVDP